MMQRMGSRLDGRAGRLIIQFACVLMLAGTAFAASTPWRFIAVGDTRGSSSTAPINNTVLSEIASEIVRQGATFVIVPGDLVYSGTSASFQSWKDIMAPVYNAGIAVYPVLGNHDANDVPDFISTFGGDIPDNGPPGEVDRTYAIQYDNVLVLALDTYAHVGRVNQSWIDDVLSTNTSPHVFAFGHMPAFKANHTDSLDDYPADRDAFWNSLKNAGATVYFCGHDHFYDHARVDDRDGNIDNDVHQMIVGGGGAPLYSSYAYDGVNTSWLPQTVFHKNQYGYSLVEVDGNTVTITYYERVGVGTYVASESWTYAMGAVPAAPTGLTATAGNATVTLDWTASSGAASYNVKRSANGGGSYTTIFPGVTGTAYIDNSAANGTTYYYAVTAVNSSGESAMSDAVSATPQPPPPPPSGLMATAGAGTVSLTWTASAGATGYNVKRSRTNGGSYTTIAGALTALTYTDTGVVGGTTYYYVVSALNASGESANSGQVYATPSVAGPGAFTLTAKTGSKRGQIRLTWTPSSGAVSYTVRRANSSGGSYIQVRTGLTGLSYTDSGLARATHYYVVTATNSGGETNSNQASARAK